MANQQIAWTGVEAFSKVLNQAGNKALIAAGGALFQGGHKIRTESMIEVPVDLSALKQSAHVTKPVTTLGRFVTVTVGYGGTAKKYAVVVHEGRRAGSRMPPLDPIKAWARRHGLPESAAFPIARKIARKGTKGRKYLAGPAKRNKPWVTRRVAKAVAKVLDD